MRDQLLSKGSEYHHRMRIVLGMLMNDLSVLTRNVAWYFNSSIRPIEPMVCFEALKIKECLRYMRKRQHIRKILVNIPQKPQDFPLIPYSQRLSLRSDRSYLLVGGLGGLGKAVSTWMVDRGAKGFIYLERSIGQS